MKRALMTSLVAGSALALGLAGSAFAYSEIHPVGTTKYLPSKTWNGYILVDVEIPATNTAKAQSYTKLVDMNGNEVHRWDGTNGMPSKMLPNGQILTAKGSWKEGSQDNITLLQLDWDGKVVWSYRNYEAVSPIPGDATDNGKSWVSRQHHDLQREGTGPYFHPGEKPVEKGKTLILGHANKLNERINAMKLQDDALYEIDWNGKVLWEYFVSEHVDDWGFSEAGFKAMQAFPPMDNPRAARKAKDSAKKEGGGFDWFHANALSYVGPNKWFDAGDQRFHPENVIVNSREGNVFGIIDRKTKKVVWRVGPYYNEGTPDVKIGQIVGPHGVHVIPKGLPGEGNILMFDNGGLGGYGEGNIMSPTGYLNARRDYSRVLEIDPTTKEIVWEYKYSLTSKRPADHFQFHFYSPFTSIAQRLPNGNTMITEGDTGRLLEVTPTLELVWEYIVPETTKAIMPLYRAYRIPYEYAPQLAKPAEVPVTPRDSFDFVIPNDNGVTPRVVK